MYFCFYHKFVYVASATAFFNRDFMLFMIDVQLIHNVTSVSGIWPSNSVLL